MSSTEKIPVYSLPDLKNAVDTSLPHLLARPPYKLRATYLLQDIRLALGYIAVLTALATFLWDYKLGWDQTKRWTAISVFVYFVVNSALTVWMLLVERGTVFEGNTEFKDGKDGRRRVRVQLRSRTKKYKPFYYLTVRWILHGEKQWEVQELQGHVGHWFTRDGVFVESEFEQWLASEVKVLRRIRSASNKSAAVTKTGKSKA